MPECKGVFCPLVKISLVVSGPTAPLMENSDSIGGETYMLVGKNETITCQVILGQMAD